MSKSNLFMSHYIIYTYFDKWHNLHALFMFFVGKMRRRRKLVQIFPRILPHPQKWPHPHPLWPSRLSPHPLLPSPPDLSTQHPSCHRQYPRGLGWWFCHPDPRCQLFVSTVNIVFFIIYVPISLYSYLFLIIFFLLCIGMQQPMPVASHQFMPGPPQPPGFPPHMMSAGAAPPPGIPPPPQDDEPPTKKQKTEDQLIPEEIFLSRHKVRVLNI